MDRKGEYMGKGRRRRTDEYRKRKGYAEAGGKWNTKLEQMGTGADKCPVWMNFKMF